MSVKPASVKPLPFGELASICACLILAIAAHLAALPAWVLITVVLAIGIRLLLAHRGRGAPPRPVRLVVGLLSIALLFFQFRTFNGLSAGTALLCLMAGMKLLETDTRRDIYVVTLLICFISIAALLHGESFWLLAYLLVLYWLTSAILLRITTAPPAPALRRSLRYAGKILAQALPLALIFWLFFPRFGGPLWQMPEDSSSAASGLSDSMSPGDIDELALSDEVAFRVRFSGAAPPARERYWRGPVMHDFDGHTWKRARIGPWHPPALTPRGPAYRYTLSLEPHRHNWLFALDWPSHWELGRASLTGDYTLVQADPVSQPIDVAATSYTHVESPEPLDTLVRRRDLRLPPGTNPRSVQLARTLRAAHPDDEGYIAAVLHLFTRESFFYTLTPPRLAAGDSVDEFLFDTKRGFCGHYASAFAVLMRAAGIPARVVTGYQGGTFNRFAGYWILRQSDAHAWDEVWSEGHGWVRVDPTAAIAPERIEHGLSDMPGADGTIASRWQQSTPWLADLRLRLDALRQLWRDRILLFNQDSQQRLLASLHIPEPDGEKLVAVLAGALSLAMLWLTWTVRREADPKPKEALVRDYARLCARLAAIGVPRHPHEGPEDYAARVGRLRPDLRVQVEALCRRYSALRYGAACEQASAAQFSAAVRAFRPALKPRGSPGS